ncbi:MAG: arginine--tRNA ligase [Candidatus Omnitrophica bacterium]|nr:arginine--tRNA ligase [Candidatus Omnitrophota bacterium]
MKNIQESLISALQHSLKEFYPEGAQGPGIILDFPTDPRFGELSTNVALQISKSTKLPPRDIAAKIVEALNKALGDSEAAGYIREIKIEGAGFINFYLQEKFFYEELRDIVARKEKALAVNLGHNRPTLIEFVSANPTGSLSVAHARQAAVGDSLANILAFIGFKVKREYYLNDEGNQINILGDSVRLRMQELSGESLEFPENYYQGDYIYDIAKVAQKRKIRKEDLGDFAANYILDIIKKELVAFGVKFDYWSSQKKLRQSGKIEKALEDLKKRGFIYEQEGAVWFKSTGFGDDKDRVVIKSDKSYTYLAPDIAYHREKYRRGFDWLINLWGPDHHGYIKRLEASVEALGHPKESLAVIIVQLATIFREGKPVQMSTRRGEYITLQEVLDEVGRDASRFFFMMRRTSSHLDFDLDVAKKQTSENPVYYVQYAHARISSILRSGKIRVNKGEDLSVLKEKEELSLIKKLWHFEATLNICLTTTDPYMLTVYLQELAESFHKFYDLHRVLGDNDALTRARLSLIEATRIVLATGLKLLGVSAPEKM